MNVRFDFQDSGVFQVRQTGRDRLPKHTVSHHGDFTVTNLATGKAFVIGWHYLEQEDKVTQNGDGTYSVLYQVPGPETIYGPDGQRLHTCGGMFRLLLTADNAGTPDDLSDDFVIAEELSATSVGSRKSPSTSANSSERSPRNPSASVSRSTVSVQKPLRVAVVLRGDGPAVVVALGMC
jgi:hypothetical protein